MQTSVFVVRAFVRLRETLANNQQISARFAELERRLENQDSAIQEILEAIKELMEPPADSKGRIGFALPGRQSE